MMNDLDTTKPLAVLASGGLDSAILLAESSQHFPQVWPLYIRCGLSWEKVEISYLKRFISSLTCASMRPATILELPVGDLYENHWSITGQNVPDADSADEAVFLPGRNVLLLSKAILWCHLNHIPTLALAPLLSNPFPDASPEFFRDFAEVVNRSVGGRVQVVCPFATLSKREVLHRGARWPLHLTFSCIQPIDADHCGVCNKCAERRKGFADAGVPDPTRYEKG